MIRAVALSILLISGPFAASAQEARSALGAVLRTLDRVSGNVIDVEMARGQTMAYGPLQVTLHDCRYPVSNPSGDAYAQLDVVDTRREETVFSGWMVASSPALMALDHPRYDVWVLRCKIS